MKYDQLVASGVHVHATLQLLAKWPILLKKAAMVKARAGHGSEQRRKECWPHDARQKAGRRSVSLSLSL